MKQANNKSIGFSEAGLALIEVLIALGVLGALMASFMHFTYLSAQSSATARLDHAMQSTLDELQILMAEPTICTAHNFGGVHFDPAAPLQVNELKMDAGTQVLVKDAAVVPGLVPEEIELKDFSDISPSSDGSKYLSKLSIKFTKTGAIGPPEVVREMPLLLTTTQHGPTDVEVDFCQQGTAGSQIDMAQVVQQVCASLGGAYNAGSGQCDTSTAPEDQEAGARCGLCADNFLGSSNLKCQGYDVCEDQCPTGYALQEVDNFLTGQKYCEKI